MRLIQHVNTSLDRRTEVECETEPRVAAYGKVEVESIFLQWYINLQVANHVPVEGPELR
jgi:hypothetical protein